jgi:hypothetical protein
LCLGGAFQQWNFCHAKGMTEHEVNFRLWYVEATIPLRNNGHAGFIFAMIGFPLLERYLRGKLSIPDDHHGLTAAAYAWLNQAFPDLAGRANEFWPGYRHALLHQATFQRSHQKAGQKVVIAVPLISGFDSRPVYLNSVGTCFFLNPLAFFDFVTTTILNDFSSYEMSSLPLPVAPNPVRGPIITTITAGAPIPSGTTIINATGIQPKRSS